MFQPNGIEPDITQHEVARAGGADVSALAAAGDRGAAVATMVKGAEVVITELYRSGRIHAVMALGGSGGTAIATAAMRSPAGRSAEADGFDRGIWRYEAVHGF